MFVSMRKRRRGMEVLEANRTRESREQRLRVGRAAEVAESQSKTKTPVGFA